MFIVVGNTPRTQRRKRLSKRCSVAYYHSSYLSLYTQTTPYVTTGEAYCDRRSNNRLLSRGETLCNPEQLWAILSNSFWSNPFRNVSTKREIRQDCSIFSLVWDNTSGKPEWSRAIQRNSEQHFDNRVTLAVICLAPRLLFIPRPSQSESHET